MATCKNTKCGRTLDSRATVCPSCGRPNPTKFTGGQIVGLIVVVLLLMSCLVGR